MATSISRWLILLILSISAAGKITLADEPPLFRRPALADASQELQLKAILLGHHGHQPEALAILKEAVKIAPFSAVAHYNLACLYAKNGKPDESLAALKEAIDLGFHEGRIVENDADLRSIRERPEFAELLAKAREPRAPLLPKPQPFDDGIAWVGNENTVWDEPTNLLRTAFDWKQPEKPHAIILEHGEVGRRLKKWFAEGTAAGNFGDLYDNCDRDHSNLKYALFPQLHRIEYRPNIQPDAPHGLQHRIIHGGVVIGNSSTSLVKTPLWRSNPRLAYTRAATVAVLARQYFSNHLYVYPEHQDHDPGHNGQGGGYGDLYPANTPYLLISQGSSYTDQPFLDALVCTLAAFRPAVKQRLVENGLISPVLQQIFRSTCRTVRTPGDYLTGRAHPTVFEGSQIDVLKMVDAAHELTEESIPPVVRLRIEHQDHPKLGRDYFEAGEREHLFDTQSAIARIGRSTQFRRQMVVNAADSFDANQHPLTFKWVVLRGDDSRIVLKPLEEDGRRAEISVAWHPRRKIQPDSSIESNRVDIGVFAHNGKNWSPPAFITWYFLDNEEREYDADGRILSVTYHGGTDEGNYTDPLLQTPKSWKDVYHYTSDGHLIGWTRTRGTSPEPEQFTADGALVIEQDDAGRATLARTVLYVAHSEDKGLPTLLQVSSDEILKYQYEGPDDQIGKIVSREKKAP